MTFTYQNNATLSFAEKVFAILDQGAKSATYKYAVLFGLLDLCLEGTEASGAPPEMITTTQLAEKVLALYWPQARPFGASGQPLRQFNDKNKQARIVSVIAAGWKASPLPWIKAADNATYKRLVSEVEWTLIKDPLPRLQKIPGLDGPFIYRIWWDENVTKALFRERDDNRVLFIADAQRHLVSLNGLLRPLLRSEWIRWVSENTGVHNEIAEYLFPADRERIAHLREPLLELQEGRCFYCGEGVDRAAEVDHFIPWTRVRNDDLGNLVIADTRCNGRKSANLPAVDHLRRWFERVQEREADFRRIAAARHWSFDPDAVVGMARGIYFNLPDGVRLWQGGTSFEKYVRSEAIHALS